MGMDWIRSCFPDYYILREFDNIDTVSNGTNNHIEVHNIKEKKNTFCMFCGRPYSEWKKKDLSHDISECLGNKKLINYCECYECNHLFGEIAENHLGKFAMPYRYLSETYGKSKKRMLLRMSL